MDSNKDIYPLPNFKALSKLNSYLYAKFLREVRIIRETLHKCRIQHIVIYLLCGTAPYKNMK